MGLKFDKVLAKRAWKALVDFIYSIDEKDPEMSGYLPGLEVIAEKLHELGFGRRQNILSPVESTPFGLPYVIRLPKDMKARCLILHPDGQKYLYVSKKDGFGEYILVKDG